MNSHQPSTTDLFRRLRSSLVAACILLFVGGIPDVARAEHCPAGCVCFSIDQVMCRQAQFTSLPPGLSPQLEHLNLNDNQLRRLPADSFAGLTRLRTLRLDNNNITEVAAHALRGLTDMDDISIQNNPLDRLAPYSFAGLKNVQRLYLSYNRIRSIESDAFYDSDNLREVSLTGNPLVTLRANAFRGFTRVQYFYFPKGLHRVEPDAFRGLRDVGMLRLDGLDTPRLERHAFRGLSHVTTFEIRGSHIKRLESGAFEGLSDIDYFSLELNTFGHVENGACDGVGRLRQVVLSGNTVQDVEAGALAGLARDGRPKRFNFTGNRLPCDCRLRYVMDDLASVAGSGLAVLEGNLCSAPDHEVGEDASAVDLEAVEPCPTEEAPLPEVEMIEVRHHGTSTPSDGMNLDDRPGPVGGISLGVKSSASRNGQQMAPLYVVLSLMMPLMVSRTIWGEQR